jgi:predicted Zn-dependent protease with MMP-like domain
MINEQETNEQTEIDAILNSTDDSSVKTGGEDTSDVTPNKFKLDNEEVTLDQVKEWKNGYLRTSDYTRKTQEIAKMREEVKDLMEVKEHLNKYPNKWKEIQPILDRQEEIIQQAQDNGTKLPEEFSEKMREIDKRILDMDIAKAKAKYPDFNETRVIKYASINDLDNLEDAFLKLKKEDDILRAELKKQVLDEIAIQQSKKTDKFNGGTNVSPKKLNLSKMNYNDLVNEALKE